MWHTGINSVIIASPKLAISRRSNEKNSKKKKKEKCAVYKYNYTSKY